MSLPNPELAAFSGAGSMPMASACERMPRAERLLPFAISCKALDAVVFIWRIFSVTMSTSLPRLP